MAYDIEAFIKDFRITDGKKFSLSDIDPKDTHGLEEEKKRAKAVLEDGIKMLQHLQDRLYAQDQWALLLIFQAMDAAGKDGAIKHVMSGLNPQGCEVHAFKAPSSEELEHDFLWRTGKDVPALYCGSTTINNSFDLVDEVARKAGGAASLFVKSGDEFVRVSTNAKTGDGSRALGVLLDPKGPAIERVRRGEAYYGESFVKDNPYIAGYEPIRDGSGEVIGIYATGYVKQ